MSKLYDYPRSSAAYRVRIACNLKGVDYEREVVNLVEGNQQSEDFLKVNPSGLVPAYAADDGTVLSQSLAILKYLDKTHPEPLLFPADARDEAAVWEMALSIGCDVHPLNNLRVLRYLENVLGADEAARSAWYAHWVQAGFTGLEARVKARGGRYCYGDAVTAADVLLTPQMFNARRFKVPLDDCPTLVEIDTRLQALPAFAAAAPDKV